ncbi:ATP-binding protein [Parasphingorhabdus sp.]|uniref:ATP-binding protein n=1 Tax=Parasphingorhabdus sp. TaxID=2709688 RepID=UPI0035936C0C
MVTNAVKHAFIKRESGVISITLTSADNEAVLTIEDDGVGLPEDIRDGAEGQGFLVAFATMARAELDCQSGNAGTRYVATMENLP